MIENRSVNENREPISSPVVLSQRRKVILALIFIIGIPLSYPTVFPFGLICSAILLFQKNKKSNIAGFILIISQIIQILVLGPALKL